ncbi:RTA-like protein [Penicillium expansum]|nr:RTA-like protein [Penicillium expansum]
MSSTDYYAYTPSLIPAVIGVGIYCALFAAHALRLFRSLAWDGIYMLIGALVQAMGLGARVFSSSNAHDFGAFGAQYVFLLLGPTLCMVTVNLTQVKMMRCLRSENLGLLPAKLRLPIYLSVNITLLLLQSIGAVIVALTHNITLLGSATKILTASYVCQMIFWMFTLAENILWSIRFGRSSSANTQLMMPHWKRYNQLFGLAISIVAMGRNMVRLTMLGMGPDGMMTVNEWPSYAFDFYQTAIILLAWGIFYLPGLKPNRDVLTRTKTSLRPMSHTERKMPTTECYSVMRAIFSSVTQNNTPYPDFYLPFDKGLSSNPALFPELDQWERHFLNLMKDIVAPSPLDKFLIGPSFHESHHLACAAVLLGDQYAQYTKTSVEVGHRRAALAVSGLRSLQISEKQDLVTALVLGVAIVTFAMHVVDGQPLLISHYTLALVKPVYRTLLAMDHGVMDMLMCLVSTETFECLVRSEVPTIRIGERDRCDVVDRILWSNGNFSPPPDFVEKFTESEVVGMFAQAKILRLAALLIAHRLRHPYGKRDKEALQLSNAITAEIDMALQSTRRSIPCTALPYTVACFEITGTEAREAVVDKIHKVVTFSRQSQLQVRRSLSAIWDARDGGDQIYWFDIGDYVR